MVPAVTRRNWRLNLLLFRAYHDAFLRVRLQEEYRAVSDVLEALAELGPNMDRKSIETIVKETWEPSVNSGYSSPSKIDVEAEDSPPNVHGLWAKIQGLSASLFQTIGLQT